VQQSVYVNGTLTAGAKNTAYSGTSANNALLASGQTLAADGTIRVEIPARVTQSTAGTLSNQASASMTSAGTLVAQTEAVDSTTSLPLTVTSAKTDGGATFYTGSTATYTMTVSNNVAGSATKGAINVNDLLPSGYTYTKPGAYLRLNLTLDESMERKQ